MNRVILLILAMSLVRLLLAFGFELGNDEAYYWLYSLHLQWNYFDHPPLVALWIRVFTGGQLLDHLEGFVRLGSVVGSAIATWLIYLTVRSIHSERAGFYAAILYSASFYASITAGVFILPDSPQMVFWTLSLYALARLFSSPEKAGNWLLFGLAAGLCILCKVHGAFLWFGLGTYILFFQRSWLKNPWLYVSILTTAVLVSPILFWNIQHDFITYRFHSNRVTINRSFNPQSFFHEVSGQLLFNNPFNALIIYLALIAFARRRLQRLPVLTLFNLTGISLAGILLGIALFRDTLPHWSGPAYVTLLPLAAVYLAERRPAFPRILYWTLGGYGLFVIGWWLFAHFYPGTTGSKNSTDLGRGDLSLDMYGWKEAGKKFSDYYHTEGHKGKGVPLVCSYWWGAHLEYYFARPAGATMIGLGPTQRLHHYAWVNEWRKNVSMDTAYCIVPSDEHYSTVKAYQAFYSVIDSVYTIPVSRGGKPAHQFIIYRLTGWRSGPENLK
jgi:4-amino-4-deoxy-L-arabinose transferase-like glycosyltransferase